MHIVWNHCGIQSQIVAYKHAYCTHGILNLEGIFIIILKVFWIGSRLDTME